MGNSAYDNLEDLVFSRSFRNWVLQSDAPEAGFWENWLDRHPDRLELVQHAKAIIYALQLDLRSLSEEDIDAEIKRALYRLRDPQLMRSLSFRPERSNRPALAWGIATLVACLCIIVWSVKIYSHRHGKDTLRRFMAGNHDKLMQMQTSETDTGRLLVLPDSSFVRLQRGSKLYYPEGLLTTDGRRQVFLEGEAFFDIKHNGALAFYVYTHTLVARVLGTSFRVKAWPSDTKTIVSVYTGKISVHRKDDLPLTAKDSLGDTGAARDGIVVTPNQELIYDRNDNRLIKTLVRHPAQIAGKDSALVFDATPVAGVFHHLQEVYGIQIVYDEGILSACMLSATLKEGSFYENLDTVCKAINASWEAIDGDIVITARTCAPGRQGQSTFVPAEKYRRS